MRGSMYTEDKVKAVKISEQVYDKILENISKNIWPAGFRLPSENELSRIFGVSRNSVRSALQRLIALELVESRNGEGTFVKTISSGVIMKSLIPMFVLQPRQILDLLELRKGVELVSCELAALRRTPEELKELEFNLNIMKKSSSQGDYLEYAKHDVNFHFCIAKMSKNSAIESVLGILKDRIYSHFVAFARRLDMSYFVKYHEAIFEAIKEGDSKRVGRYLKETLENSIMAVQKNIDTF